MYRDRNETTKTIKSALKARSGKDWSVTGGRGTGWGWLNIEAPKARRIVHISNPAHVDPWTTPDVPCYVEVEPAPDEEGYYMSDADRRELADLLGLDRPAHFQGVSISPDEWNFYVDRAVNGKPAPEPTPEPEPAPMIWIVAEPDTAAIDPVITDVEAANLYVTARFALLNKRPTLEDYRAEVALGEEEYEVERCKIVRIAALTDEGFDAFADNLLTSFPWLDGEGGHATNEDIEGEWQHWTEAQQELFKATCYAVVIAVTAPNRDTIYVNPSGHSYARYVGI